MRVPYEVYRTHSGIDRIQLSRQMIGSPDLAQKKREIVSEDFMLCLSPAAV
jgi:hypothetical protein